MEAFDLDQNDLSSDHGPGRGQGRRRGTGGGGGRGGRGRRWLGDYSLLDVRLIEPALLAFLQEEASHGYGLLEKLDQLGLGAIQPSVVYRILRDFEAIGLVESDWDSELTQGPPRRVYTITAEGRAVLARAKNSLRESIDRIESLLRIIEDDSVSE